MGRGMAEVDALQLRLSLKHLIEPERGMGEVFKVLIQHKGMDQPQLDGLRDFGSIPWSSSPHPISLPSGVEGRVKGASCQKTKCVCTKWLYQCHYI